MKSKILLMIFALSVGIVIPKIISYRKASPIIIEIQKDYRNSFEYLIKNNREISSKIDFQKNGDVYILKVKILRMQSYESAHREVSDIIIAWAQTREYQAAIYQFGPLNFHNTDGPIYFQIDRMDKISRDYPDNVDTSHIPENIFPNR